MYHPYPDDRAAAIAQAKTLLSQDPLFLDTETTGLTDRDEICEIAVIDARGDVLINSLVKPARKTDWHAAAEIHGITREMVQDAPTFRDLLPELERVLRDRTVVAYNVEFDQGKLWASADANELVEPDFKPWWFPWNIDEEPPRSRWHCAMELYAAFYGDWNEYRHSYRWIRLSTAAQQCGIVLSDGVHRAHADAELTRRLMQHIASQSRHVQISFLDSYTPEA